MCFKIAFERRKCHTVTDSVRQAVSFQPRVTKQGKNWESPAVRKDYRHVSVDHCVCDTIVL